MDFNDACLNLNLTPIFTVWELKKQYRMLSLKYHPDKHMPDADNFYCNKFKIIAESYHYLYTYLEERDGISYESNNDENNDNSYNSLFSNKIVGAEEAGNTLTVEIKRVAGSTNDSSDYNSVVISDTEINLNRASGHSRASTNTFTTYS